MKSLRKPVRIEVEELRRRLQETEDTLEAIRSGEVDALVVSGPGGEKVFTLQGAEHPYRVIVENINEGAATLSGDGVVLYCNRALARMVRHRLETIIGKPLKALTKDVSEHELAELFRTAMKRSTRAQVMLATADGTSIPVQLSLNPIAIDEQTVIAAIITDLSERIDRQRAQDAVRARDEFIMVASHELRTPLSTLMIELAIAQRSTTRRQNGITARAIEKAQKQAGRIETLVDRLLDASRAAQGRLILERAEFDLGEAVSETVERFMDDAAEAGSKIRVSATRGIVISFDKSLIDQAVSNLLANALKFGRGKPIDVTVQTGEASSATISVRDYGIGLNAADLGRIFDRFERSASAREYGGLGLGLYITRQIVTQHGGTVRAESSPGAGAEFIIELPTEPASRKTA